MTTSSNRPKVFVAFKALPQAIDLLKEKCEVSVWNDIKPVPRYVLLEKIASQDALYCHCSVTVDEELLDEGKNLKVITTMSSGFDHLDVDACRIRGIRVGYTPDAMTDSCAELGVALILCTARRLIEAHQDVYNGNWTYWHPTYMNGKSLRDSTVGFVGMGRIGSSMAEKLRSFRLGEILYHNRKPSVRAAELGARFATMDQLLTNSDFVICCCPLTPESVGMFNKEKFSKMKPTAMFFNISRGGVVVQDDLYDALQTGQIAAAGLDVCTPEPLPVNHMLLSLKNLVILPHIGALTTEAQNRMAILAAENVLAGLDGKPLPAEIS